MNKRIKTEKKLLPTKSTTRAPVKRARSSTKSNVTAKRPVRKRTALNFRDSSSDDDFLPLSLRRNGPNGSGAVTRTTAKRGLSERYYEISDTSDDEILICELKKCIVPNNVVNTSDVFVLNDSDSLPSTSNGGETVSSRNNADSILEFIDNLLGKDEDNLNDSNILKSIRELNEETDKLLESSLELINESNSARSAEDSVVYVCTSKDPMKLPLPPKGNKNDTKKLDSASVDLTNEQEAPLKPQCPICLESLGTEAVSATVCGHTFCTSCIRNCIKSMRKCPTCRKNLTLKMIHPLFLF